MFALDPQLAADGFDLGGLGLCRLLLMNDARYPWCVLVPQRPGVREIHHLAEADRLALLDESCRLAQAMERLFAPDKLNVAALGNVVAQLHIHHVARYRADAAWPGPIWGQGARQPYGARLQAQRSEALRAALGMA